MINGLVLLYVVLGSNFGLAIIAFTIISRILMFPLTMRQLRQTSAMQKLAPQMKSMQEKYKNDRQRLQREQMRLYREAGVNPLGCLGPMIIQMPIFFGLFIAIRAALADTPEGLVSLSSKLYSWLPGGDAAILSTRGSWVWTWDRHRPIARFQSCCRSWWAGPCGSCRR